MTGVLENKQETVVAQKGMPCATRLHATEIPL